MLGAIIGDVVGSRFEFNNIKTKEFELVTDKSTYTDDTVLTLAVTDWLTTPGSQLQDFLIRYARKYYDAGYGPQFSRWCMMKNPRPYNSCGNGSAMRVSAVGCVANSVEEALEIAKDSALPTHNHPEGIKGAEATAVATFLARTGKSMDDIREVVVGDYYPLGFTLDEIRSDYEFDVSCQGSVPQALEAFFESTSFEDAIRNAISIGGDSDTIGAICGAVAGAYYGVPDEICAKAMTFLTSDLVETLHGFEHGIGAAR